MDSNKLIELVRVHPTLYSRQLSSGNTSEQKNEIWKSIAVKMNEPVEKCKAKWRNLRDSYQKAMKYRRELETIGKEDLYHEYKHETVLSFLEVGSKRKSVDSEKRSKQSKKPRDEYVELAYNVDCSQNVEYIVESEQDNECRVEEDDDQSMFQSSSIEEDQQMHEIPDDHSQIENEPSQVKNEEQMTETVCLYETRIEGENESTPQEEISYQETFIDERPVQHTELDLWLNSLKQTLLSFPKLMRARAKKNINDIVSDLEIAYLEAIEIDRSQSS